MKTKTLTGNAYVISIFGTNNFLGIGYTIGIIATLMDLEKSKRIKSYRKRFMETGSTDEAVKELKNILQDKLKPFDVDDKKLRDYLGVHSYDIMVMENDFVKNFVDTVKFFESIILKTQPAPFETAVLKLKEKHGDNYYLLKDPDQAARTYFEILKNRSEQGWYTWMKNYKADKDYAPKFTQEEVNALPESMADKKMEMQKELDNYTKENKEALVIRNTFAEITKCIKEKDGRKACEILKDQNDGEYEGMEIIDMNIVE